MATGSQVKTIIGRRAFLTGLAVGRATLAGGRGLLGRVADPLTAGAAKVDITPTLEGRIGGINNIDVNATAKYPPTTMVVGLANDYHGYIPTPEAHALGGYETWRATSSYLEVEAAPRLISAALQGLQTLASRSVSS
ncbi:MAG: hypothetical protein ACRD1R_20730 [Acidobacteriota bacterium]